MGFPRSHLDIQGEAEIPDDLPPGARVYSFRILPDGSTDLDLSSKWYLTVIEEKSIEVPPPNFATVQIGPLTGSIRIYRP